MTETVSPELRGLAEAYGVPFETADDALKGLRLYINKLGPEDQQTFISANGAALAHAEYTYKEAREASQRQDFTGMHPHTAFEAHMRSGGAVIEGDAERRAAQERPAARPRRMTNDERADAVWAKAQATFDISDNDLPRIDEAARRVVQERGYRADDFNDDVLQNEFVQQVGAAAGLKPKAPGKTAGKGSSQRAAASDTASLNYGGRGMAAKDADDAPPSEADANRAWLRETTEYQNKMGLR